jgi:hypothetical protein
MGAEDLLGVPCRLSTRYVHLQLPGGAAPSATDPILRARHNRRQSRRNVLAGGPVRAPGGFGPGLRSYTENGVNELALTVHVVLENEPVRTRDTNGHRHAADAS